MTNWGDGYYEGERGRFEAVLVRFDGYDKYGHGIYKEICYTDGDTIQIGSGYKSKDVAKVKEYAEWYDLRIEWK